MDSERFHYLFVNAGCLAELALRDVAAELDLAAPAHDDAATQPTMTDEELAASFDNLDFDALGDLGALDAPGDGEAGEPGADQDTPVPGIVPALDPDADKLNFDQYLGRAYGQLPAQHPRVETALAKADANKLDSLLANVPQDLTPITGPLDSSALEAWLNRYRADDEAVTALVVYARQLDQ
ncbi:MAG: hypothetical protein AAFN78_04205 [Pseudomonadota bacterium]